MSLRYLLDWICRAALGIAISGISVAAKADIGVVVADPTTIGVSVYTHAGHSLVYLSGVCAASPIRARLCEEGEQGSVVTTYPDFRETQAYAWNLVPLSLYLHGSLTPGDRLLYGSRLIKDALEVHAREGFLQEVCGEGHCPQIQHSFWRDLVDANAMRDIFIFAVHTTREQDQAAVDWLNYEPNVNHYNGFTNNCAVFTRSLVNLIFPHSVHRDFPNDLGMMGPKAAARSFTHWAKKRPELGFYSMHFAQQPGDLPRSAVAQSGTETAIHMKKYLIPAALIGDHEVAGSFFVAYFLTGRFGVYKEFMRHPSSLASEPEIASETEENRTEVKWSYVGTDAEQKQSTVLGLPQDWADYRERFAAMQDSAEVKEFAHKRFFPRQFDSGKASVDDSGHPWLTMEIGGATRKVGISNRNLMAAESDPELAFQLMLGRVGYMLHAKNHMRETMEEFRKDWALLEQARNRLLPNHDQQLKVASLP
ncbi:MAG TPA: hypothetical protein VK578_22765 [Edaphobacter sp.]|nr:hypothetical protein [Edaphobacter sp.]